MEIAMIGLGRMGANMAQRLMRGGHRVVGYDPAVAARTLLEKRGAETAASLEQMVEKLTGRRAPMTLQRKIQYVDSGTSGGICGLAEGYSLMIGGDEAVVEKLRPIFETLAPAKDQGWGRVGPVGSGHYTKMVHNGIEYGLMQAYAEGFSILQHKSEFKLDLHQIAEIWRYGSVVRSWLLDLTADALGKNPTLEGIAPFVADSGEGRWTVADAIELGVSAPVITLSLLERLRSRDDDSFTDKLLAAMRNQFGGHEIKKE